MNPFVNPIQPLALGLDVGWHMTLRTSGQEALQLLLVVLDGFLACCTEPLELLILVKETELSHQEARALAMMPFVAHVTGDHLGVVLDLSVADALNHS